MIRMFPGRRKRMADIPLSGFTSIVYLDFADLMEKCIYMIGMFSVHFHRWHAAAKARLFRAMRHDQGFPVTWVLETDACICSRVCYNSMHMAFIFILERMIVCFYSAAG